uniref:C2H2-type domain-containing protein n=1 Tax=Glossina brevipalpis TaxID=37001 RepID=A0A1A9WWQ6_9MUSC
MSEFTDEIISTQIIEIDNDDRELISFSEGEEDEAKLTNQKDCLNSLVEFVGLDTESMDMAGVLADDLANHNLILSECLDENEQMTEIYHCYECKTEFASVHDFVEAHPGIAEDEVNSENVKEFEDKHALNTLNNLVIIGEEQTNHPDYVKEEIHEELETDSSECVTKNDIDGMNTDTEGYFCYDCQQIFPNLTIAEQHECALNKQNSAQSYEKEAVEKTDFTCAHCQQSCDSYDELLNHAFKCELKKADALNNSFCCDICGKTFATLRSLNVHKRVHKHTNLLLESNDDSAVTMSNNAICEICNTQFSSPKNLKLHMKIHNKRATKTIQDALPAGAQSEYGDLNLFYCEICNKSFDQNLLAIHKNMHQNVLEYNCSKCNRQFDTLASYEMHTQMHAENSAGRKTFSKDSQATKQIETGRTKFPCQYCGREFPRPYEKVKHERIHTGEKPYGCEVCGKTFRVSYSLTLHLRTHTDIRPYVCTVCNKRFKSQSVYVHHLNTHETERPYKCDMCPKAFRTSVQLCGHKNSHRKPFTCTECNRPFATLYAVKVHMKTHSNGSEILNKGSKNQCNICGATYVRVFALRCHLKTQHGVDVKNLQSSNEAETLLPVCDEISLMEENIMADEMDVTPENAEFIEIQNATRAIAKTDDLTLDEIEMNKSFY